MYRGSPTYNPEFHPEDLIKQMKQGSLDVQVYASWEISKKSFYSWLQEHQELKEAYDVGFALCESWWLSEMKRKWQEGDEKGFKYCALIVNTKFGYRENQNPSVTNNTLINVHGNINNIQEKNRQELIEFIKAGLEDNNILPAEFKVLEHKDGSE